MVLCLRNLCGIINCLVNVVSELYDGVEICEWEGLVLSGFLFFLVVYWFFLSSIMFVFFIRYKEEEVVRIKEKIIGGSFWFRIDI